MSPVREQYPKEFTDGRGDGIRSAEGSDGNEQYARESEKQCRDNANEEGWHETDVVMTASYCLCRALCRTRANPEIEYQVDPSFPL